MTKTHALCIAVLSGLYAPFAFAQAVTEADMQRLDLSEIDGLIKNIERQVELVRLGSSGQATLQAAPEATAEVALNVVPTNRQRTNPLCFAESEYDHGTPAQLETYFENVEQSVSLVSSTLKSFNDLSASYGEGECPGFMIEMLSAAENSLSKVSRPELSDLSYHLETCWPDDGVVEVDGAPIDMDLRYARARNSLDLYRRAARNFGQAQDWCQK